MRTSEIQASILAQKGITIDDYYCDPKIDAAREIFCRLTNCGPSDEEVAAFLHAQKPACNRVFLKQQLEEELEQLEIDKKKAEKAIVAKAKELEKLKEQEDTAQRDWLYGPHRSLQELAPKKKAAIAALEALKAASKRPPAKQVAALEGEIATLELQIAAQESERSRLQNESYKLSNAKRECAKELKELKNRPNLLYHQERSVKNKLAGVLQHDDRYYQQDEKALDLFFALLLKVELAERQFDSKEVVPTLPMTTEQQMKAIATHLKKKNTVPKDWRQQLYRICSSPLRRFVGTISNPREGKADFFDFDKKDLRPTDLAAFLSLKMSALQSEYVLAGNGAIVLALPGGLAAMVKFREKGKVIAKQQKQPVEVYVNCLLSKEQYAYHLMYHYDGGPAEGVGIETPGAYYILSENYVVEIAFMASPMLLGFENMARTAPPLPFTVRREDDVPSQEEFVWDGGEWEED